MEYTDKFFEFPIRVYDGFEAWKAIEMEAKAIDLNADDAEPIESPWVEGSAGILADDIIGYQEMFSKVREVKDVAERGFDLTVIYTKTDAPHMCTWSLRKFKRELNAHMKKLEDEKRKGVEEARAAVLSGVYFLSPNSTKTHY